MNSYTSTHSKQFSIHAPIRLLPLCAVALILVGCGGEEISGQEVSEMESAITSVLYHNDFETGSTNNLIQAYDPAVTWSVQTGLPGGHFYQGRLIYSNTNPFKMGAVIVNQPVPQHYVAEAKMYSNSADVNAWLEGIIRANSVLIFDWQYRATAPYMNFKWAAIPVQSNGVPVCMMGEYHDGWVIKHSYPGCESAAGLFHVSLDVNGQLVKMSVNGQEKLTYYFATPNTGPVGVATAACLPLPGGAYACPPGWNGAPVRSSFDFIKISVP